MNKELLLFSGGVDSCVLLKHFLKETNKEILCLYVHCAQTTYKHLTTDMEYQAAKTTIDYFKKNYRAFDFLEAKIEMHIPVQAKVWFRDPGWLIFLAGIHAKAFRIKKIWHGTYSYIVRDFADMGYDSVNGPPSFWYNGYLYQYLNFATHYDADQRDMEICCPKTHFQGKGIDRFLTKREAFEYLDPELRKMVRSCYESEKFCGRCKKCQHWMKVGIINEKGELLI